MSDTLFLLQPQIPPDTVRKAAVPLAGDTARKSVPESVAKDTSKKSADPTSYALSTAADTSRHKVLNTSRETVTVAETAAQNFPAGSEKQQLAERDTDGNNAVAEETLVPLYPPYIYHIDDTTHYGEIQLYNIDSLLTANDSVFYHRSLFRGHTYVAKDNATQQRVGNGTPLWVFATIILVMFLLGRLFSGYKGRKTDILLSPFSRLSLKNLLNERAINKVSVGLMVDFLYSVLLTFAEFFVIRHFGVSITGHPVLDILVLEAFTFVFIYARVLLVRFIGSVFNYKISIGAYVLNQSICNLLCGMLLVPALLLGFYSGLDTTALLYILTIIISVMFLIRVVRGSLLMLSESQFSKIYMLYYMFVIEIVPVVVVAKWITLNM